MQRFFDKLMHVHLVRVFLVRRDGRQLGCPLTR